MKKTLSKICLTCGILLSLVGCNESEKENLVILYTNDVHCSVDQNIGYAGLKAYKDKLISEGDNVLLVDCGDHTQGQSIGKVSKGEYLIDIMNEVGYDYAVPGNHEFDYGYQKFNENVERANFTYLSSNLLYTKNKERVFQPYAVVEKSGYKIGLLGICTPDTLGCSVPKLFMDETGVVQYTFLEGNDPTPFYNNIQESIDNLKKEKVDYIIAMAHMGDSGTYTSDNLIKNTDGIDVFLDGHSHSVVESNRVKDKNGNYVIISQTGTGLVNIGKLVISKKGNISTGLVVPTEKDTHITDVINNYKSIYEASLNKKIGHTDYLLTIADPNTGKRRVRLFDTNMSDLVADAFLAYNDCDCGFINGGGVRADIKVGDITYNDVLTVCPYDNYIAYGYISGQMIMDYLELGAVDLPNESSGLVTPAGLTYSVDTSFESNIEYGDNLEFVRVNGKYRVNNVKIKGQDLVLDKWYKAVLTDYNLVNCIDAENMFKDAKDIVIDETLTYGEQVINYIINDLKGEIPEKYSNPLGDGRVSYSA